MSITLHELLGATTVTRVISQIKTPMSRFQDFWGMGIGGANVNSPGGKNLQWDIFDRTRTVAMGRPPGTGPATIAPNPVGVVNAAAYRAHEQLPLLEERIFRTRPPGGQFGEVDARGQSYVTRQEGYLSQRFSNNREFLVSRMMRGVCHIAISGDNWVATDDESNAHMTVDFRLPAINKGNINDYEQQSGTENIAVPQGDWDSAATDILGQVLHINAMFEQDHGYPLRHVWVTANTMLSVMRNDSMTIVAGTANRVFTQFDPTGMVNAEGIADTGFTVVLEAAPWLTWHVYEGGLDLADVTGTSINPNVGNFTKMVPSNRAIFTVEPNDAIAEWQEGSEVVAENVMDAGDERFGFSAWTTRAIDPASFQLKALDVGLPGLYLPKTIAFLLIDGQV